MSHNYETPHRREARGTQDRGRSTVNATSLPLGYSAADERARVEDLSIRDLVWLFDEFAFVQTESGFYCPRASGLKRHMAHLCSEATWQCRECGHFGTIHELQRVVLENARALSRLNEMLRAASV